MVAIWNFPTRILYGSGAAEFVGSEAKALGGTRALLVSDDAVQDAGATARIGEILGKESIAVTVFTGVTSNPKELEARAAAAAYGDFGADIVVAVGGGSVIDTGKLVRVLVESASGFSLEGAGAETTIHPRGPLAPMIAITTTAGTGAEATAGAMITVAKTFRRTLVRAPALMPSVAILDPVLTGTMPTNVAAATGFEAVVRCIEAYSATGEHPMADAIAVEGLRLAVKHLPNALSEKDELASRGAMLKAALMGGVARQKGLGACDALAGALSSKFELHHGLASALCLPAVLDFNRATIPARVARIAQLLHVRGDDEETLAFECSGALRALRKKIGLPGSLGEVPVEEAALPELAAIAATSPSLRDNPRPCSEDDLLAILRASA